MAIAIATPCIIAGPTSAHCLDVMSYSPRFFFFIECRIAWQVELAFSNASCFISISDASVLEITLLITSISRDTKSSYGFPGLCLMFEKEEVDFFS